jgi:hypothetical protein
VVEATSDRAYSVSGVTGTVAAALAQDAIVFAMLVDPAGGLWSYLEAIRLAFTTIVAFGTPITAGRRLGLYRATGGVAATGGAAMVVKSKHQGGPASVVTSARIATTGGLTVGGITRDADPLAVADLVHVGAAGARAEFLYDFLSPRTPHKIVAGDLLVISTPVAMDAGGTWQLGVTVDWRDNLPRL